MLNQVKWLIFFLGLQGGTYYGYSSYNESFFLRTYNVGQGNFLHLKVPTGEDIIIDCGSSSYAKELSLQQKKEAPSPAATPPKESFSEEPGSGRTGKAPNLKGKEFTDVSTTKTKTNFFQKTRQNFKKLNANSNESLRETNNPESIWVKTIIITHPDQDHYGWLSELLNKADDKIDHIILGGLPFNYKVDKFLTWLNKKYQGGTKVYFPAIREDNIQINDLQTLWDQEDYSEFKPRYQGPMQDYFLKEAFEVPGLTTYCLGLNTMHFSLPNKKIIRALNSDETNPDSIALKFSYGVHSLISLGDMEEKNLRLLIDTLDEKELQTDILVASHHGAWEKGCNLPDFLKRCAPHIVIFSNGYTFGHPRLEVYQALKELDCLAVVPGGKEIYWGGEMPLKTKRSTNYNRYERWKVFHAYFSTLYDGTITCEWKEDEKENILIKTEKNNASFEISRRRVVSDQILQEMYPEAQQDMGTFWEGKYICDEAEPVIPEKREREEDSESDEGRQPYKKTKSSLGPIYLQFSPPS